MAIDTESRDGFIERVKIEEAQREQFDDVDATRIVFRTEDGEVVEFSMNGDEVLGKGSNGDISTIVFEQDPNGDVAGLVVNDDGTFTPFAPGEDVSGKTVIVPTQDGGFNLIRPDGSRTKIEFGENGVEARDGNGNGVALPKDSQGRLDLGEGLAVEDSNIEFVEGGHEQAFPEPADQSNNSGGWDFGGRNLLIILVALAAVAGTVWWFVAMKPKFRLREELAEVPSTTPASPPRQVSSWDAFDAYLLELKANSDPAQAIRQAYAYAEQGMGSLVARHPDQTPFEWCESVAQGESEQARTLRSLTNLYSSIRFGDQAPTSSERDQAVDELSQLVRGAFK